MRFVKQMVAAPAIVMLMGGTAQAALTADQIWKSWQSSAAEIGLTITAATEANSGGVLTLNGVSAKPAGEDDMPLTLSTLILTENSDGTVTIAPGDAIGLSSGGEDEGLNAKLTHENLVIVAREADAGGIIYDYSADQLDLSFESVMTEPDYGATDGENAEPTKTVNKGTFSVAALAGSYSDLPGANRVFGLELTADSLGYDYSMDAPSLEIQSSQSSVSEGVSLSGSFTLPSTIKLAEIATAADFGAALDQGLAASFTAKQDSSTGTGSETNMFFPYSMTATSGASTADFLFNKDVVKLDSRSDKLNFEVTSGMSEAPMKGELGVMEMALLSPVRALDTAEDYRFMLNLSDVSLSDDVWAMFDPQSALQRDAFDLALDLTGKTKIDWPSFLASDESDPSLPPALPQPETLDITTAALKAAGAAMTATGSLTFDNSQGFPVPLGEANVIVTGSEQLINGLIAAGYVSEEDAMGMRMMMGAFFVPGADKDSLSSQLEFKEGGQIFANGQQIQ